MFVCMLFGGDDICMYICVFVVLDSGDIYNCRFTTTLYSISVVFYIHIIG